MATMEAAASVVDVPCVDVAAEDSVPISASASQTCFSNSVHSSVGGGGDTDSIQSDAGCMTSSPLASSAWDSQDNWGSLATELEQAVEEGNIEYAKHLVALLAEKQAQIKVAILAMQPKQQERQISIKLHVEDKTCGAPMMIDVCPASTIRELKQMMRWQCGFPVQVQKWIIGKRLPKDNETLEACGVRTSGTSVYVYLVSSRSVGLTRAEFHAEQQRQAEITEQGQGVAASPVVPGTATQTMIAAPQPAMNPLRLPDHEYLLGAVGGIPQDPVVKSPPPPRPLHPPVGHVPMQIPSTTPPADSGSPTSVIAPLAAEHQLVNPTPRSKSRSKPLKEALHILAPGSNKRPTAAGYGASVTGGGTDPATGDAGALGLNMTDTVAAVEAILEPTELNSCIVLPNVPNTSNVQDGSSKDGWSCSTCTYINFPTRPGCQMCTTARPENYLVPQTYNIPDNERRRLVMEKQSEQKARESEARRQHSLDENSQANYQEILATDDQNLVQCSEDFTCCVCLEEIKSGQGIVLRECLHTFCRGCLNDAVLYNESAIQQCPYQDDEYACNAQLQDREVRALVSTEVYEQHLRRSLVTAETQAPNSYHCKTVNCHGWCFFEDDVNFFHCPVCGHQNCLTCRALHEGLNCKQYQQNVVLLAMNDDSAKQTQDMLEVMLRDGEAMRCPRCGIIVQKKGGCDWLCCSICKLEICWVTKGPRWGPGGQGDTNGGCRCRADGGTTCHPNCINCH